MPTQVSPLRLILFGIIALWVLSLFLPAFRTCDMYVEHEKHAVGDADDGWLVLVFGWLGPAALSWWIGDIPDRTYPAACAALRVLRALRNNL